LHGTKEQVVPNEHKHDNTKEPNILIIISILDHIIKKWLELPIVLSECSSNPHMDEEDQESKCSNAP
jgi:hypothetical protein